MGFHMNHLHGTVDESLEMSSIISSAKWFKNVFC